MFFKDEYHEDLFNQFISKLNTDDIYYRGFSHVASATGKTEILDALGDHEIKNELLLEISKVWSNSQRSMLEIAWQVFSDNNLYEEDEINFPSINSLFRSLDSYNFKVAIEAITSKYS